MPAPPRKTPGPAEPAEPPFYEAAEHLYIDGGPESGVMPVRAFAAGDRVPPDLVAVYGWHDQVRVPAVFAEDTPDDPPATQAEPPARVSSPPPSGTD